jgi:G3E family GTPase
VVSGRIPVTLLSGFLGSGKTTMVNHVVTDSSGLRVAVVVNEFGELGIDSALISGEASGLIELRGGCVCCVNRGDLGRALTELVASGRPIDHILVEASGLTDPGPTIEALVSPALADKVSFSGTVSVIDAANFDRNLESAEAAYNQISYADLLVINKSDLVDGAAIDAIRSGLRRLNAEAPIIAATNSAIPVETILGEKDWDLGRSQPVPAGEHRPHELTAISLPISTPLALTKLTAWLESLPESVLRAKGIVRFGPRPDDVAAVQSVAGQVAVTDLPVNGLPPTGESVLILIGDSIGSPTARAELERGLLGCAL